MLQLLEKYGRIACLDSTHNTCFSAAGREEKAFLYTIVLKNLATGKGCPASFMLTPVETQYPIIQWLRWLLVALGFKPDCWMIDCSDTEVAGIRGVHGPLARIFECLWHVLKSVVEQAKKKLSVAKPPAGTTKVEANRALRDGAKADFTRMVYAATKDEFEEVWKEVQETYSEYPEWLAYLRKEWVVKKERWALSWREVSKSSWSAAVQFHGLIIRALARTSHTIASRQITMSSLGIIS